MKNINKGRIATFWENQKLSILTLIQYFLIFFALYIAVIWPIKHILSIVTEIKDDVKKEAPKVEKEEKDSVHLFD